MVVFHGFLNNEGRNKQTISNYTLFATQATHRLKLLVLLRAESEYPDCLNVSPPAPHRPLLLRPCSSSRLSSASFWPTSVLASREATQPLHSRLLTRLLTLGPLCRPPCPRHLCHHACYHDFWAVDAAHSGGSSPLDGVGNPAEPGPEPPPARAWLDWCAPPAPYVLETQQCRERFSIQYASPSSLFSACTASNTPLVCRVHLHHAQYPTGVQGGLHVRPHLPPCPSHLPWNRLSVPSFSTASHIYALHTVAKHVG